MQFIYSTWHRTIYNQQFFPVCTVLCFLLRICITYDQHMQHILNVQQQIWCYRSPDREPLWTLFVYSILSVGNMAACEVVEFCTCTAHTHRVFRASCVLVGRSEFDDKYRWKRVWHQSLFSSTYITDYNVVHGRCEWSKKKNTKKKEFECITPSMAFCCLLFISFFFCIIFFFCTFPFK